MFFIHFKNCHFGHFNQKKKKKFCKSIPNGLKRVKNIKLAKPNFAGRRCRRSTNFPDTNSTYLQDSLCIQVHYNEGAL